MQAFCSQCYFSIINSINIIFISVNFLLLLNLPKSVPGCSGCWIFLFLLFPFPPIHWKFISSLCLFVHLIRCSKTGPNDHSHFFIHLKFSFQLILFTIVFRFVKFAFVQYWIYILQGLSLYLHITNVTKLQLLLSKQPLLILYSVPISLLSLKMIKICHAQYNGFWHRTFDKYNF